MNLLNLHGWTVTDVKTGVNDPSSVVKANGNGRHVSTASGENVTHDE